MASITSRLIVSLVDQVSGPAKAMGNALKNMGRIVKEAGNPASFGTQLEARMAQNNRALEATRGRILEAAGTLYVLKTALTAPISSAMDLETALSGISSKAGLSADAISKLRADLRGASGATNQTTGDLAAAVDKLVGMGMSAADATAAIKSIGMASTATGANVLDMSDAGFAAMSNLKVSAENLPAAFDAMAQAGKRGGFELKDMAAYFPSIGSSYAALGQSGTGAVADLAAALQIMRKNTGDASSAATNLQNVIQKTYAPGTVKKFQEQGVDIFKEMEAAAKKGLTPLEAIAEITNKTLGGDLSRIGFLFEDAQAQAGVRSLIQNMEEFRSIRADAMGAKGVNQADFDRAMDTTAERAKRAQIAFSNLSESVGSALLPSIEAISDAITPMLDGFARFTENNPNLVAAITTTTTGLIGLRAAGIGLSFLGLLAQGGMLATISAGFTGISTAATGLGVAISALSAPIWLPIAGAMLLAGIAAGLIWKYWDRISSIVGGFASELMTQLGPAFEYLEPVMTPIAALGSAIGDGFAWAWEKAKEFGSWLGSFFSQEKLSDADKEKFREAGKVAARMLVDSFKATFSTIYEWFRSIPGKIVDAIGSIDLSGILKWPSLPEWMGGGSPTPTPGVNPRGAGTVPARATGGPISRGSTYLVGERGPELITAGRSGYVNKAGTGQGAGVTVHQQFTFSINGNADQTALEKIRQAMRDEVRETFRGVFADTGMRMA